MFTILALLVLCIGSFGDACYCGDDDCLLITTPTTFMSPNYPERYDYGEDCSTTVVPPSDKCVQLTFHFFETNWDDDFLAIRGDGQLIQNRHGTSYKCLDVVQLDSYEEVTMQFTSQSNTGYWRGDGFSMEISFIECPGDYVSYSNCTCGSCETITETKTVISPNFPAAYPEDVECAFSINPPEGQCFRMEFAYFNTAFYHDYLYIYEGEDDEDDYYTYVAGHRQGSVLITGPHHFMFEDWGSASSGLDVPSGFSINFVLTSECEQSTIVQDCGPLDTVTCGPTVVRSKNYPVAHSNDMDCSIYITPTPEMYAVIQFDTIALEEGYDYLYIYENGLEVAEIDDFYCNNTYPAYYGAVGSPLVVRFTSDGSVTYQGFSYTVFFHTVACPPGFTEYLPNKCYKIVHDVSINKPDAKTDCEETCNAKLFEYESVEEFTTIRHLIKYSTVFNTQPRYWIGLTRENTETTTWTWGLDGIVITDADLVWGRGEPNNKAGNEVCGNMLQQRGYKLNDANCDNKFGGYVCMVTISGSP